MGRACCKNDKKVEKAILDRLRDVSRHTVIGERDHTGEVEYPVRSEP
jgi:hypothetical protein